MSSSGSTSNNMNNTIDENKMEHMMDYLAFTVNGKGKEMIENLSKIKADMKNVTKKILKENQNRMNTEWQDALKLLLNIFDNFI